MTISLALRRGMHTANRSRRLWFIFYAVLTAAALVPATVVMSIAIESLGHSAWAEELGRSLDVEWMGELMAAYGGMPMQPVLPALIAAMLFASVAHVFLMGGALEMFVHRQWFSGSFFFGGCGRNFWRMLRLSIEYLILLAIIIGLNVGLKATGDKIWGEGSADTPLIYWAWFRAVIVLLLFGLATMIYDYAAIHLVSANSRSAFREIWWACRMIWNNLGRTAGLAAALWCILLALVAIYVAISKALPQRTVAVVLLLLLVRQAMVLARIWSRLLFYSSQCELYDGL